MKRLAALLPHDLRLQRRYGIFYAYAFVIGFYVLVLTYGAAYLPAWLPGFVIYSDPAVVGFFFLGALMLLEKAEQSRLALALTPVSAAEYFWSKAITLTALALVSVAILALFLHRDVNWPVLLLSTALTSLFFLGLGVHMGFLFKTASAYLIGSSGVLLPVVVPAFLALADPMPLWAALWPTAAQFRLILAATGMFPITVLDIFVMTGVAALSAAISIWSAIRRLAGEFGT